MTINIKKISLIFLFFLLVNGFFIANNFNSTFLIPPIAIIFSLIIQKNITAPLFFLTQKRLTISIFTSLLILLLINLLIIIAHHTYDLSYAKNFVSLILQLICTLFFFAYLLNCYPLENNTFSYSKYIGKLIVIIFVIQSVIEIVAFLSPSVASLVHIFYAPDQYEILYKNYGGIRGVALTGSPGWGLAVGFAYSFLFYTRYYILDRKINVPIFIMGVLLILGSFFAGRSALAGIIFSLILFLWSDKSLISKLSIFFKFTLYLLLFITLSYLLLNDIVMILIDKVFPFVFEFFYKYAHHGKLETGSTNVLIEMWNRDIPQDSELFGTGWFTDPYTGKYYLRTDVGYVRNFLFGGYFWLFLVLSFGLYIMLKSYKYSQNLDRKLIMLFFIMSFLLEAKAMLISYNKYYFIIIISYLYSLYLDHGKLHAN